MIESLNKSGRVKRWEGGFSVAVPTRRLFPEGSVVVADPAALDALAAVIARAAPTGEVVVEGRTISRAAAAAAYLAAHGIAADRVRTRTLPEHHAYEDSIEVTCRLEGSP